MQALSIILAAVTFEDLRKVTEPHNTFSESARERTNGSRFRCAYHAEHMDGTDDADKRGREGRREGGSAVKVEWETQ